jgi:hypothetical protein
MKKILFLIMLSFGMLVPTIAQNIPSYVPTNGLVGYWPLDGNSDDIVGNRDGILNNGNTTSNRLGELNSAIKFNGTNANIHLIDPGLNPGQYEYTINLWYRLDDLSKQHQTFLNSNPHNLIGIGYNGFHSGANTFLLIGNGNIWLNEGNWTIPQGLNYQNGNWTNLTLTKKGNIHRLYINGVLKNENSYGDIPNTTIELKLGSASYNGDFLNGAIDDLSIFNRALSQQEITALYTNIPHCTPPTAAITPRSSTNIKENESVVLAATQGNGYSYEWYKDGTVIPNAIDSNYTATTPGNYTVKISTSQTCDSTSAAVAVKRIYTLPNYLPTNGLIGYWPFNGNANDESGNGNNGTVNGAALTLDRHGNPNKAYLFTVNGNKSWGSEQQNIVVPNPTIPEVNAFTMSSWVKIQPKPSPYNDRPHSIMGRWDGNGTGVFRFQVNNNTNYYAGETFLPSDLPRIISCPIINFNEWHHSLMSYDGNVLKQYIDGVMINQYAINIQLPYSNSNLTFGEIHMSNGHWLFFNGIMDEVVYWSRALSQQEITALYNACTPPTAVITPKSSTNIKENESVVLAATKGSGYSYEWYKDGIAIPNAIDSNYTATTPGNYTVKITTSQTCDSTSAAVTVKRIYTLPNYLPTNGLVGWWPFNGNANDESGNGNHGTVNGATLTSDRNGEVNKAYSFNGVDNNVVINHSESLNFNNAQSISIWVYQSISNDGFFINKGCESNSSQNVSFRMYNTNINGNLVITADNWTSTRSFTSYKRAFKARWHNYIYVYDGQQIKLFEDGNLVSNSIQNGALNNSIGYELIFGCRQNEINNCLNSFYFNGLLDDIAIYNRALTQQEITALYLGDCTTPIATATAQSATSFCQGSSVNLSATTNANYTYQWLNNGVSISNATSATYKATTAGKYSVIVKNNTGCVDTSSTISVAVTSLATPIITGPATLCYNSKAIFKASIAGGTWGVVNDYMLLSSPQGLFRNNKMPPTNLYKTGVKYTLTSKDKSCSVTAQKSVWIRNVAATSVTLTASKQTLKVGEEVAATATTKIIGNGIYWMSASTSFVSVTGVSPYIALIKGLRPATGANITFSVDDAAKGCRNAAFLPFTVTVASSMVTSDATQQMATTGLHTYPNPSNGSLYIENLGDATSIKLVDVTGRTLQTNSVIADRMQLDYKHIVKGNYFIHVQGNETNEVKAITIE